jgi:hypothetical protein
MTYLTEHERTTIANALRVAAEQYGKDAEAIRADKFHASPRMAEQFDMQKAEAVVMAGRIEQADEIELDEPREMDVD